MNTSARNKLHQQTTETGFIRKELALHALHTAVIGGRRLKHGLCQ
ncbi:hypothetical protein [Arsenophonus nasoniae]|nr:hypothetical protein [Arsenophonus nasoniae]